MKTGAHKKINSCAKIASLKKMVFDFLAGSLKREQECKMLGKLNHRPDGLAKEKREERQKDNHASIGRYC